MVSFPARVFLHLQDIELVGQLFCCASPGIVSRVVERISRYSRATRAGDLTCEPVAQ